MLRYVLKIFTFSKKYCSRTENLSPIFKEGEVEAGIGLSFPKLVETRDHDVESLTRKQGRAAERTFCKAAALDSANTLLWERERRQVGLMWRVGLSEKENETRSVHVMPEVGWTLGLN